MWGPRRRGHPQRRPAYDDVDDHHHDLDDDENDGLFIHALLPPNPLRGSPNQT